ncbi:MAG TPA: AAA family ATPase [Gemmataceae bacterium]|nr:AAA family ATPase [Gemmataceae bacterium]
MESATFLTRVVLENYKSIAHCDVCLGPLNYLVGPNGAGKSNFLDALRFVADALKHSVGQALRSRGGGAAICHAPHHREGRFRVRLEFSARDGAVGHYALTVGHREKTPSAPWEVQEEVLTLPPRPGEANAGLAGRPPDHQSIFGGRLALACVADHPAYREVYAALTRMLFYNIKPRNIEDVVTFDPSQFLPSDGSNLASTFFRLGAGEEGAADRINDYLRLILPGLIKVRAEPVIPQETELPPDAPKVALLFEQGFRGGGVHLFWPSQMSEGTLRSLGIVTALLQATVAEGPRPSLVGIEEPEAQVHPAALAALRDAMVEASYSTQVLVTTQSPDILDSKDVSTDSILAVSAEDGATRIAPIDANGRDLIRRRLFTPGELLRIGQIFPERSPNGAPSPPAQPAPVGGGN